MGKGGGCFPSKTKRQSSLHEPQPIPNESSIPTLDLDTTQTTDCASSDLSQPTKLLRLYIIFYSMYGHVEDLARRIKKGVDSVEGIEGHLFRVPETLTPEILSAMHAPQKDPDIPEITASELQEADGFLFGFPTRFGCMAAQMKSFFDSTGQVWKSQGLANKAAGFFVSTGTQGGGQETTAWTAITQLAHHGMLFVPIGYTFGGGMYKMDEVRGGSPYGAGVYAGDGTRAATETELALAEYQGKYMASIVKKLAI